MEEYIPRRQKIKPEFILAKKQKALPVNERIQKIVDLLIIKKADNIKVLNLTKVNSYLDYFVIVTANSESHLRGLAKELTRLMKKLKEKKINLAQPGQKGWILMDYVDIIIQLFTEEMRNFYNLEKLWGDSIDMTSDFIRNTLNKNLHKKKK
jgi:ribosome-associated protein